MIAQSSYEIGEKAFNRAYNNQRKMYDIMPDTASDVPHFIAQEFSEINVFGDEYRSLNGAVQTGSLRLIQAHPASRLIIREHEETGEKQKRSENEDKVYHGS